MKLKTFKDALMEAINRCNNLKKLPEECYKIGDTYDDNGYVNPDKYNKMLEIRSKIVAYEESCDNFFKTTLPNFIKENKIKGEQLTKLAMVFLKYMQISHDDEGLAESIFYYCDKSNMHNSTLLKKLIETSENNSDISEYIDKVFSDNNLSYWEDYYIHKLNVNDLTSFIIKHQAIPGLNFAKFEKKILRKGSFDNLYDYMYNVYDCNQGKVLKRILEIATPKQLKRFSKAMKKKALFLCLECLLVQSVLEFF